MGTETFIINRSFFSSFAALEETGFWDTKSYSMVPALRDYCMYIYDTLQEKLQVIILNIFLERCAVSDTELERMEDHRGTVAKGSHGKKLVVFKLGRNGSSEKEYALHKMLW